MCIGCYREYKQRHPEYTDINDRMIRLVGRIKLLEKSGNLHIVIDDWNLGDGDIQWCIDRGLDERMLSIAKELLDLSLPERYEVMAFVEVLNYE